MSERKEPQLGPIEHLEKPDRIPTLTELADTGPAGGENATPKPESAAAPPIGDEDIAMLADRVLDQLAPVMREAIAVALDELLTERGLSRS